MRNEPTGVSLQLARVDPGWNMHFVRQQTTGHGSSPLWRGMPGEEHRELCTASWAVRLSVRLQIKALRLEMVLEPRIILNRT